MIYTGSLQMLALDKSIFKMETLNDQLALKKCVFAFVKIFG